MEQIICERMMLLKVFSDKKVVKALSNAFHDFKSDIRYDDGSEKNVAVHSEEEVRMAYSLIEKILIELGYHPMQKKFPLNKIDKN